MKPKRLAVWACSAAVFAAAAFAQGKGGGGGNSRGGGGGNAFGHGNDAPRGIDAPKPDRAEKPGRGDEARKPNGRSAKPAAQELAGSMRDINQTAFAQRKELHEALDMRLKSSRDALKQIQADAKNLRGAAHDEFKASLEAVKGRERELESALKAARKSTEATWDRDRSALDRAYRNFNDAMGRLEGLPRPPRPPGL